MNTNELPSSTADAAGEPLVDPTGQLLLLADAPLQTSSEHARFQLSRETRQLGLRHVAQIRAQLAAARERQEPAADVVVLRPRRRPAA